jgi:hypothetical protein
MLIHTAGETGGTPNQGRPITPLKKLNIQKAPPNERHGLLIPRHIRAIYGIISGTCITTLIHAYNSAA